MKKLLLLFIALVFSISAFAQKGAKIEFKQDTIDYGTVAKQDDNGERSFVFTNTGDAPLIITNATSTCGCTVPSFPKEPILPGKSSSIQVKYNMSLGPIRKTITVQSNAMNYPDGVVALKIKGTVVDKDKVSPLEKKKSMVNQ